MIRVRIRVYDGLWCHSIMLTVNTIPCVACWRIMVLSSVHLLLIQKNCGTKYRALFRVSKLGTYHYLEILTLFVSPRTDFLVRVRVRVRVYNGLWRHVSMSTLYLTCWHQIGHSIFCPIFSFKHSLTNYFGPYFFVCKIMTRLALFYSSTVTIR